MLTAAQIRQAGRRRHPPASLKQQYQEYVMQRIESYKNSIHRDDLLRLGDEAVAELQAGAEGQFVLTEVLMLDAVDRLIMKRLRIRAYRNWRQQFLALRTAQREPTHWGLDARCPVASLLPRLEPQDMTLVVGGGAEPCTYLLAAHDAAVVFVAADLGSVERVESRIESEALGTTFAAYVVQFGGWLPTFERPFDVVVLDAGALGELDAGLCGDVVRELQRLTAPQGVHVLLPSPGLAAEALLSWYGGWHRERGAKGRREVRAGIALARESGGATEG